MGSIFILDRLGMYIASLVQAILRVVLYGKHNSQFRQGPPEVIQRSFTAFLAV